MEEFKNENNVENDSPLKLDKEKIETALWGRSIEVGVRELIKVFSIITHIKGKRISSKENLEEIATDLFEEFDVSIFDYSDIFTNKVINQILEQKAIENISVEFNGTPIVITKGSTVESVVDTWEKAGYNSPEATEEREAAAKKSSEKVSQQQEIINQMFTSLDSLDFSDQHAVVDWLYEYNTHLINGIDMHEDALIEKFGVNGFSPEKNDAIEGMLGETLKDKKRLGEVIVGYMLMNLGLFLRNDEMKRAIADWKKM